MKGTYNIIVRNARNEYNFTLNRNITILRGDSATGKSTLYKMIVEYNKNERKSGVHLRCKKNVIAYVKTANWEKDLKKIKDSIVIVDEDSDFIITKEFANIVKKSTNYFLLITRNYLKQLPYSVNEIYSLEGKKKKKFVNQYINSAYFYTNILKQYDVLIVEDSASGYEFYLKTVNNRIETISSKGRDNITNVAEKYKNKKILIIADGAAFGPEMDKIITLSNQKGYSITLFLPESFEWIILKSGIIQKNIKELKNTANFVESSKYESWEQFFTDLLINLTKNNKIKKYSKRKLTKYYLVQKNVDEIYKVIKLMDLK